MGEIALVARIVEILADAAAPPDADVLVGPGDDAAVLSCEGDVVITTDSQHEGVHFQRSWMTATQLGRRAVAVNASDLGAMGARPRGFLVALAMPPDTAVDWVEDLARGLRDGAARYGAGIVGGDVAAVSGAVSINVSAVGERPRGVTASRSAASPGQRLFVTGWPGRAAAGVRLLQGDADDDDARRCIAAFREPAPPVDFGIAAAGRGLVAAMMDISDGLAIDLGRMCRASGAGAELDAAALQADAVLAAVAERCGSRLRDLVLGGGDDYELLCAVRSGDVAELRRLAAGHDIELREIGVVVDAAIGINLLGEDGREPLGQGGWDHFSC